MSTVPHTLEPVHFSPQTIYCGDCEDILRSFPANSVDLIYIDPPFNSNRNYEVFWGDTQEKRAFDDRYGDAMAYIDYMRPRVEQLHRVLKPTGSFYYHCDWHASHYIKVMLDEIFGANQFQSEIVWKRTTAHSDTKQGRKTFGIVTECIFFYTKSMEWTWNPIYVPYDQSYLESHYKSIEPHTGRRFQLDNLTGPGGAAKGNPEYEVMGVKKHWRFSKARMEKLIVEGRVVQPKPGAVPRYKRYLDEMPGIPLQNLWNDIYPINSQAKERLGYPTQKPLALLERIIKASSNPGDIVLDGFCGCGTALVAAQQLGRRWVGVDISPSACNVMGQRLEDICGLRQAPPSMGTEEVANSWDKHAGGTGKDFAYYRFSNLPRSREQLRALPGFEFENWAVLQLGQVLQQQDNRFRARVNRSKVGDLGLDGRIYLADRVSIKSGDGGMFGEQDYLPIQVKNTDKVGRPEIDKFETALLRDGRKGGFFIGWEFSKDAEKEIERLRRLPEPLWIIPTRVDSLIAEDFKSELAGLLMAQ